MKTLIAALVLLAFFLGPITSPAAEVTYTAGMKGIECADCKKTISRALGKIKGVKTIRIAKEGDDQHRLTVVTDGSKAITKADAVAALGKDSHYSLTSWSQGS
jgi:copper chaperone CopZ